MYVFLKMLRKTDANLVMKYKSEDSRVIRIGLVKSDLASETTSIDMALSSKHTTNQQTIGGMNGEAARERVVY